MGYIELNGLEERVDHLLQKMKTLDTENTELRSQLALKQSHSSDLHMKLEHAKDTIKNLITQLKKELPHD